MLQWLIGLPIPEATRSAPAASAERGIKLFLDQIS
jgi:hypothetical protein